MLVHPVHVGGPDLEHLAGRRGAVAIGVEVELEVDPVVELEAGRQLPHARLAAPHQRRLLRDMVAQARMVGPEVVGHQARVVEEAVFLDQTQRRGREVGRGRAIAERRDIDAPERLQPALHIPALLVGRQLAGVDVGVRVMANLVAGIQDRRDRLGEGVDRVAGNEEGGRDRIALEQFEHARHADARAVLAAREHRGRGVGVAEPDRHGVEIKRETDGTVGHRWAPVA